ncbi:CotS family spore coat protein [Anaerobacillus sp. MEB173]|uniref:CotS family spore coat protein n=1 Tax=Anaerobacillus sp. MEB173 TaxID=3383345 RepID=UPI003F93DAA7
MKKKKVITPWDMDETLGERLVPEYIVEMAYDVIKNYDLELNNMEVMATKEDKGGLIWKIDTDKGPKSFKILHRRPTRSMFSLGAQDYLVKERKANVPAIIPTRSGENWVKSGGKLWFVAEWIEPLEPVSKDLEGTTELCYALGEFHRLSKGYVPPKGAEVSTRLYRWPKTYEKIIKKIGWFKDIAKAYNEMPASSTILSVADMFQEQARSAYSNLLDSDYDLLVSRGNEAWGLAHQDYGWSNGQKGPGGMWIIDLDGVSYDLPIRDLQKIITQTMEYLGSWNTHWAIEMIQAYHEANPIEDDLFDILLIDLSLPNLFYRNLKDLVYEPTTFMDEQFAEMIHQIVDLNENKENVLADLEKQWKGGK